MLVGDADDAPPDTVSDGDKHGVPWRRADRKQFLIDSQECIESQLVGSGGAQGILKH